MNKTQLDIIKRDLLNKAKKEIREFNPYKDLNLFSVLGMENKEVTAHSAFLFSVFKPFKMGENIDCDNLKILIELLLKKTPINISKNDIKNASIYREYSTEYGRIDFLIEYSTIDDRKNAIVIELKVWAGEQENQIDRYADYLDSQNYYKTHIFFLTPSGYSASTDTKQISIPISLKTDIVNVLENIIDKTEDQYSSYISILKQYIELVNKLTGEEFMSNAIKSKEDIKAVEVLINERTTILTDLLIAFAEYICKSSSDFSNDPLIENVYSIQNNNELYNKAKNYYKKGNSAFQILAFKLNKNKLNENGRSKFKKVLQEENAELLFFLEIDYRLFGGLTIRRIEGENLVAIDLRGTVTGGTAGGWIKNDWDYINYNSNNINFYDYSDEQTGALNLLKESTLELDDKKLEDVVGAVHILYRNIVEKYFEK